MKKIKKEDNYLDYVPKKSQDINWIEKEDGLVQIIIPRDSLFERIVRKLFFTPENYKVDLDKIGTFIWNKINGTNNLYQIGEELKVEFGDEVSPLYDRLIHYINILKNNKFIKF